MYRRNCQRIDIKVDYLVRNDYNIVVSYSPLEQSSLIKTDEGQMILPSYRNDICGTFDHNIVVENNR